MSRDTIVKLVIMSAAAIVGAILLAAHGMSFSFLELAGPVGVVAALGPCAVFYHRRRTPQFVMTLLALMQLMVFTSCFTVAMYGVAALNTPLVDDLLAATDAAIGLHVPKFVQWASAHPQLDRWMMLAYHSVIPQTLVVVLILGFRRKRVALETFVLRYMLCLVFTLLLFAAMPAIGPFSFYDFSPSPHQKHYLQHLLNTRVGELTAVSLSDCEGLITFPSFHTSYAILLASAFWGNWRLFVPFAILNAVVIAATLTSGWHYGIDVFGGVATVAITMYVTSRLKTWIYATNHISLEARNTVTGGREPVMPSV